MSYLNEAFKALSALNEDTFTLSDDGIKKLSEFEQNDDLSDDISVIDTEAETEDELQDSYVGKVILDCSVCHSKLYKDKEEVTLDEEGLLANVGEECPYCYTSDGFKVIGEVSEFSDETETNDDDVEKPVDDENTDDDVETLDESLTEDYSEKYIIKAKTNDGKVFYYDAELDNLTTEVERATQYADYDIANDDLAMILGSCENDFEFITVETVPQLDLVNKDDTVEEAVGTLERPMSTLDGTLGNVLTAHKDELAKVRGREDGLSFLDSIEPEVKNKGYLRRIKEQIAKIPEYKVPMLLYNLILKGDGMGTKMESKSLKESLYEEANESDIKRFINSSDEFKELFNEYVDDVGKDNIDYFEFMFDYDLEDDYNQYAMNNSPIHTQVYSLIDNIADDWDNHAKDSEIGMLNKNTISGYYCFREDIYMPDFCDELKDTLLSTYSDSKYKNYNIELILTIDDYDEYDYNAFIYGKLGSNITVKVFTFGDDEDDGDYNNPEFRQLYNQFKHINAYAINTPGDFNESLKESVNNVNVETDDATVSVSQDDNGTVTVQTTPKDDATTPMSDETIVPVSDETQTEIENNVGDDEEIDITIDEFDEESFDELGESYLKRIYENVSSYHTTNITNYNDQIKVEGVIKFDSGNEKKTSFIFESKDCTKSGKLRFIGENVEITNGKKAFTITGSLNEKKFITESFNYNYKTTNEDGTSSRIYGTLRKGRASK